MGVGASNTGSLQQSVLLLARYRGERVWTRHTNTAHVAPLTSAKEVAMNSSEKPKRESHTAPRGTHSPALGGAAASTWLHMEPGIAGEPEGDTWLALCRALPIPANTPQPATVGSQRLRQPGSGHSGFSKATRPVLVSSCRILTSGGHQTGIQARVKTLEGKFRILRLRCQKALPPSPSRRRSCGRCTGRCPHC